MTFDEIKDNWQQQKTGKLNIDSDLLLKEVQRNKRHFEYAVFWRDVREVGLAIPACIFFLYVGLKDEALCLSFLLLGGMCAFVAIFLVIDRIIQRKKIPQPLESLTDCITTSFAQVDHQIWLLKNVFWWYLLPLGIGLAVLVGQIAWTIRNTPELGMKFLVGYAIFCVLLFWGIYALNQWAVRKHLVPRQQELMQLQNSLQNSTE